MGYLPWNSDNEEYTPAPSSAVASNNYIHLSTQYLLNVTILKAVVGRALVYHCVPTTGQWMTHSLHVTSAPFPSPNHPNPHAIVCSCG